MIDYDCQDQISLSKSDGPVRTDHPRKRPTPQQNVRKLACKRTPVSGVIGAQKRTTIPMDQTAAWFSRWRDRDGGGGSLVRSRCERAGCKAISEIAGDLLLSRKLGRKAICTPEDAFDNPGAVRSCCHAQLIAAPVLGFVERFVGKLDGNFA
jgi:hypothetical protein